jgi:hypothetical protein
MEEKELFTSKEFCEAVGASRVTVWRWVKTEPHPVIKVGIHSFFTRDHVNTFKSRRGTRSSALPHAITSLSARAIRAQEVTACAITMHALASFGGSYRLFAGDLAEYLEREVVGMLRKPKASASTPITPIGGTPIEDHIQTLQD